MSRKVREFRGLVYTRYDSESDFARALNWPKQKVSRISSGAKEPGLAEIDEMSPLLGVSPAELMQIFLRHKSPNEQQN